METTQYNRVTTKYVFLGTSILCIFLHYDKLVGSAIMVFIIMAFARYELSQIKAQAKKTLVKIIDGKEYSWVTNRPVVGLNKKEDQVTNEIIQSYESNGFVIRLLPYGMNAQNKIILNFEIQSIWKRERDSGGGDRTKPDLGIKKSLKLPRPKIFPIQKARTKALQR